LARPTVEGVAVEADAAGAGTSSVASVGSAEALATGIGG
jgi:hypothetical protein